MRDLSHDVITIIFFAGMIIFSLSFCMSFFKYRRKVYPGYTHWIIASSLNALGLFLLSIRAYSPDFLTIILSNTSLILFFVFVFSGIDKFAGIKTSAKAINLSILILMICVFLYYTYIKADINMRIIVFSLSSALTILTGIFTSIKQLKKNTSCRTTMLLASLYTLCIWFFLRAAAHSMLPWKILPDYVNMNSVNLICVTVMVLASIFIIISLIVLTTEKLSNGLSCTNKKLEKTLSEVKELRGLIPICSICKKIRNDKGYYEAIESYIQSHTDVSFSHTLCDQCAETFYPEIKNKLLSKNNT